MMHGYWENSPPSSHLPQPSPGHSHEVWAVSGPSTGLRHRGERGGGSQRRHIGTDKQKASRLPAATTTCWARVFCRRKSSPPALPAGKQAQGFGKSRRRRLVLPQSPCQPRQRLQPPSSARAVPAAGAGPRHSTELCLSEEGVVHLHKLELRLDAVAVVEAAVQDLLGRLGGCGSVKLEVHKTLQWEDRHAHTDTHTGRREGQAVREAAVKMVVASFRHCWHRQGRC